ncbi:2-keto-4-pentenoate hydratase [Pseudovibrio sp. Ad26]|nr:2-keto-4-pentenoate hydratase [Pseudovibrio sp. Ad26]
MRYVRRANMPQKFVQMSGLNVPQSLDEAYSLIRHQGIQDHLEIGGWKLGGTTRSTQSIFKVDELYFGALDSTEIAHVPTLAPTRKLLQSRAEVEIAFRISSTVNPTPIQEVPIENLFDQWCVAVEMPSSPIENIAEFGVETLIADRCAAGFLVLGKPYSLRSSQIQPWHEASLCLFQDDQKLAEGTSDQLVWPAEECARRFLLSALEKDFQPRPGQWISTGGITPCVSIEEGARISIQRDGILELEFQVKGKI